MDAKSADNPKSLLEARYKAFERGNVDYKDHAHIHFTVKYEREHEIISHTKYAEFRKHEGQRKF